MAYVEMLFHEDCCRESLYALGELGVVQLIDESEVREQNLNRHVVSRCKSICV